MGNIKLSDELRKYLLNRGILSKFKANIGKGFDYSLKDTTLIDIASSFDWSVTGEGSAYWRYISRGFIRDKDKRMKAMNNNNDTNNTLKTQFQIQLDKLGRLEIEYHKAIAEATRVKKEIKMCSEALQYQLNKESM